MSKWCFLLAILAVTAPSLAVAADNQNNNGNSQNSKGLPFTANDPPATDFNSNSKGRPAGFPPVPGCSNGVAKGNPHCQPASP